MIRPPLPRVRDGDVLGLGLMNSLIHRVEYAADLLRQGKPLAGDEIAVQENYDGTVISFSEILFGELEWFLASWGGPDGWSGTIEVENLTAGLKKQFIRFENIKQNFNGNFGLLAVGVYRSSLALQIWNANAARDDGFNIFLNNNFLSQLLFDFNTPSGGFYTTPGWDYGTDPSGGGLPIDLFAQQSVIKTIPRSYFGY